MITFAEFFVESDIKYKTLYHVGTSPPKPVPLSRSYSDHSAVKDIKNGVFLTDEPKKLVSSIRGELLYQTIKRARKIKRDAKGEKQTRPALSQLLKIWAVDVPQSLIYKLGGIQNNANIHNCREIVIPKEYWPLVRVRRSTKQIEDLRGSIYKVSSYDNSNILGWKGPWDPTKFIHKIIDKDENDLKLILKNLPPNKLRDTKVAIQKQIDYWQSRKFDFSSPSQVAKHKRLEKIVNLI